MGLSMITSELDAIKIFIVGCGIGAGAWTVHSNVARIHLHKGEFTGMGTKAVGAVFCRDNGVVVMSTLTPATHRHGKLFKGELADPNFFNKFKVELEMLRDA